MLKLFEGPHDRREFLRVGSLAPFLAAGGGLSLSHLLRARAAAAQTSPVKDCSVVLLFLHGGPSQTETFDPKMSAPAGVRSVTGEVATSIPGVTFGATFERLARLAGKLCVVRSFMTGDGDHNLKPVVGRHTSGANLGSLYARVAGTNHPETGMPTNIALFPRAVDPDAQPANLGFGNFAATGSLGAAYAPFVPGGGGDMERDMTLRLPRERLDDRRGLLAGLDRLRRAIEQAGGAGAAGTAGDFGGLDRFQEQAFDTILGGVGRAFDISREDPRTIARYDTSGLVRADQISKRWNNHRNYADNVKTLGKLLLMARRLCEAGCRFVTVTTNFVWDMHADENNATVEEGMRYCGLPFDHAVSAFIEDVEARGLRDRILLVACGEMGRTPKVNRNGGRDHWGKLAPLLIYGGGLRMGQVIGQSSRDAGEPASDPVTIPDLAATVLHTLFDIGALRVTGGIPREVERAATEGQPIPGLA
jgi:hypothetical protein